MAIHQLAGAGVMNLRPRCQASLLWLCPTSTIPQTYEAWRISPKGARRQRATFGPIPCIVGDLSLIFQNATSSQHVLI